MVPGIAITAPRSIAFPKSTFMVAAAAEMPGCGGTKQCTMYKADAKQSTNVKRIVGVCCPIISTKPINTTKPESQKMGKPTANPVINMAIGAPLSPVQRSKAAAKLNVAPDFSNKIPRVVPRITNNPTFSKVLPKPVFNSSMILYPSNPAASPVAMEMTSNTKKVWSRNRALNSKMPEMASNKRVEMYSTGMN